ncbi:MAG: 23S rRNA (adenine(2503)-C(2))-methyltransferase RlmN [Bacteroidota bacterium]|nr:23S rRNA (adenine(2503)-C(2))-methyltransferase RlmN [Bacteroidota bacterium]
MKEKDYLFGKTLEDLERITEQYGQKKFVAKQISDWLYKKDATSIMEMSNISKSFREVLNKEFFFGITPYVQVLTSKDGTKKYLFQYSEDTFVEAVCIFDKERVTLCISTQAGCKMNCDFCATGKQGFKRNLSTNEILNIFRSVEEYRQIKNIVYMGMGEPLDNFFEVKRSLEILCKEYGYGFSPKRITVSTAGYLPFLEQFLEQTNVDIAISLHNPIPMERERIMPIEKVYSIEKVIKVLRRFDWTKQRHLTFEYIVFEGLNDQDKHINSLLKLLNGLKCRINLIPFNTIPNSIYKGVEREKMILFQQKLNKKGFLTTIRASKGEDIMAACGLLSTKKLERK